VAAARRISDVEELRRLGRLQDIVFFEVRGWRRDGFDAEPKLEQGTNVMQLTEGDTLSTRFRTALEGPDGTYVVDLAVVFKFPESCQFDPDAVQAFGGTVALPIAHPFIRETLRDLSSKLGLKRPLLQLLPPEGIQLEDFSPDDTTTPT
jgi:hypothetical protein